MRILAISNYYAPLELGGWEQLVRDAVEALSGRGHELRVLTSNYRIDELDSVDAKVDRALHLESPDHAHYHPSDTFFYRHRERENCRHVNRVIKEFSPEVVWINGMWNLSHRVAKQAEKDLPGRVVYYMAGYWPTELSAHAAYWRDPADRVGLRGPKRLLGSLVTRYWLYQDTRSMLDFSLVLCVSAFVRDQLALRAGIPRERTRVLHNGVELDLFRVGRDENSMRDSLRLLYAGRLSPDKGVHTAIESLQRLKSCPAELPVTLSIVGGGASDYLDRLHQQVQRHGLDDQVTFYGQVPRPRMPGLMAEHDVLVFPSIWPEPLARVVQEAMASQLVVIGTPTGGTPEILRDGENGLVFEVEDANMLAEKITELTRRPDKRTALSRAGRKTVVDRFSMDRARRTSPGFRDAAAPLSLDPGCLPVSWLPSRSGKCNLLMGRRGEEKSGRSRFCCFLCRHGRGSAGRSVESTVEKAWLLARVPWPARRERKFFETAGMRWMLRWQSDSSWLS